MLAGVLSPWCRSPNESDGQFVGLGLAITAEINAQMNFPNISMR
jgi:hypothetical protein